MFTGSTNLGWECPKCGSCFSPTVQQCSNCCNNGGWTTYPAVACTCGLYASWCPVHSELQWEYTTTSDATIVPECEEATTNAPGDEGARFGANPNWPEPGGSKAWPEPAVSYGHAKQELPVPECGCEENQIGPCSKGPFNHR